MKLALSIILVCAVKADVGCLLVDQSSVTAGELAAAIPEFRAIAANRHLVWAPAPGLTRWLRAVELHQMAAREGVTVAAGLSVCLQRRTIVFSEEQVLSALRERLPTGSEIRIVDYCRLPMMSGRLRFEARPAVLAAGENRQLYWKGSVIGDDRRTAPFWASVQVRIERRVVRAARLIPAKAILTIEDLTEEIEKSGLVEVGPAPTRSDLVGKETSRRIDPQQLINRSWLRTPQLVRRGQTVHVMVESGQALLGLDARALNGGNKGDTLLMKNDESGKSFRAEVTGPGKAVVRMEIQPK